MSFGFKKKLPAQKRTQNDGARSKESSKSDLNVTNANALNIDNNCCIGDNNGNSGEFFAPFANNFYDDIDGDRWYNGFDFFAPFYSVTA